MGVASMKVRTAPAGIPFSPMPPNSRGKFMLAKIALKKCYHTKIRDQNVAKYFQLLLKFWRFLNLKRNILKEYSHLILIFAPKKMLMATA
jgi:hypothetical protein